jgi:hypothetical protein
MVLEKKNPGGYEAINNYEHEDSTGFLTGRTKYLVLLTIACFYITLGVFIMGLVVSQSLLKDLTK